MAGRILDRFSGAVLAPFGKMPCDTATSAPINLTGYQTVSAVNLNTDNMRCLVMNQTDTTLNGIYMVKSAQWIRAADFDGPTGTVTGQLTLVTGGNQAGIWELQSPNPIQIDHSGGQTTSPSPIIFSRWSGSGIGSYDIDVTSFGAKSDARMVLDLVTNSGSPIVTSATANFVNLLVGLGGDIGKTFKGFGYGGPGGLILGTIISVQAPTQATISVNATASCTAGQGLGYWGTDSGDALNAAYLHASAVISQIQGGPNSPSGAGMVRVKHPVVPGVGDGYLTTKTLTTYRNVIIDADAMMYNAIGLGDNDRGWFMKCAAGIQIDRLIVECGGGMGITNGTAGVNSSSYIRRLQIWNAGTNFNAALSPNWQIGIALAGFDYNITDFWCKGGNINVQCVSASDLRMTLMELIGFATAISLSGCENMQFNKMTFDTGSFIGMVCDGSHNIFGDGNSFSVNVTGLTHSVSCGLFDHTNLNRNIKIDLNCQRPGGNGVYVAYSQDCYFKVLASNSANYSGGGVDMTYGVSYGAGNAGIIEVDLLRDNTSSPAVANYTGSQYGLLWDKYMNGTTPTCHLIGTFTNP